MRKLLLGFGLALGLAAASAAAAAQGYSPAAQKVLTRARLAAGGGAWNSLRGWHEAGRLGATPYETWLDPLRYGMRVETREADGLHVHGFNGGGDWRIAPSGQATGADIRGVISQTRTDAFFDIRGYFYPGRFDARGEYVGVRSFQGRSFDVVMVKPWAAEPRELWFDRRSHLLARMVDRTGPRPVAQQFSDYRKVGGVRIAFRIWTEGPSGTPVAVRQIESVTFGPVDRNLFSLPRRNAEAEAAPAPAR
ncbi:hypothetical protein [Phenylobacterium soli]|uniref:Outer membrane lipoprotein-sorting protein n=1 Tax=Phenylobacterium soli TaxID=2170551 RepID=A0A328AKK1_9CAUL|nr:hypothetical protein [Phenylobacterium soli]RAK53934.1 hypothetical protein DJ017_05060 [Phenylobacterium soli]